MTEQNETGQNEIGPNGIEQSVIGQNELVQTAPAQGEPVQDAASELEQDAAVVAAKSQLRRYYRWKYGELPPKGWQADHQVEQNPRFASRFGDLYVHNIANLIYVPADVNAAKNRRYFHPWASIPVKYKRMCNPQIWQTRLEAVSADAKNELEAKPIVGIRDALEMIIEFLPDDEAFVFLHEFSQDALLEIVARKSRKAWVDEPPEWLQTNPEWLDRLRDEILHHDVYVTEFAALEEQKALEREFYLAEWTEGELERMFYCSSE